MQAVFAEWWRYGRGGRSEFCAGRLVADVPHRVIERRVVDEMQRHRQFDGTQPGGKVAAGRLTLFSRYCRSSSHSFGKLSLGSERSSSGFSASAVVGYLAISRLIRYSYQRS